MMNRLMMKWMCLVGLLFASHLTFAAVNQEADKCPTMDPDQEQTEKGDTVQSCDPNEMNGPLGIGEKRYVKRGERLDYTIYFENMSNATASACLITVTLPLDPGLDVDSLEFGDVVFGANVEQGLVGKTLETAKECTTPLANSASSVKTNVKRLLTGEIKWTMMIYDPTTPDHLPTDPSAGFLPPNDEEHRGEGYVRYSVKVHDDAEPESVINASAVIVFDDNPPIPTDPAWWNTVGLLAEVSLTVDGVETNLTLVSGQPFGELPVPAAREGQRFIGWFTGPNGTGLMATPDAIVPESDFTLYECWESLGGEARFAEDWICVDEGSNLTIRVCGGDSKLASSVQVLATYNTAAAADLDLKGATVDGAAVKSFKFPVTLSWAAGEIGEKSIEIPVVVDKTVETDEFLTLELANPMNLAMGETPACTVTIRDPQHDALKAKVADGTATKAEADALAKADKVFAGKAYVRGLANDATRGKVTGSALVADGKNAKLKATANKGYVFAGWYTDLACTAGHELIGYGDYRNPSLSYPNINGAVTVYARFIMPEEDDLELGEDFLPAEFAVNEAVSISVPVESVSYPTVTVSGLPPGLKYYAKETLVKATKTTGAYTIPANTIYGTPTKATTKPAMVTVTVKNLGGYQIVRKYEVSVVATEPSPAKAKVLSDAPHYYSVAIDLSDDFAGKVTGAGVYQADKKVTLKATANKGYVFNGWYAGADLLSQAASYALTMPTNDVAYVARFVIAEEDKASIGATVAGFAFGAAAEDGGSTGNATNVMCGVYLEWPVAASALSQPTVAVSGLPSGLKFTAKPITTKVTSGTGKSKVTTVVTNVPPNTIYGAPTAASKTAKDKTTGLMTVKPSVVKVTVTTAGKNAQTYQIDMTVDPLPAWAVGTFAGPSYGGGRGATALPGDTVDTNGAATVTIAASGKITAKQPVDGKSTSFAANYFDVYDGDSFWATLTAKVGKEIVTNEMVVSGHAGRVTLPGGGEQIVTSGVIEADLFDAWQYNWKDDSWKAIGKAFDKREYVYVVKADGSFSISDEDVASPLGTEMFGRVTLKFSANGTAKVAGEFAKLDDEGVPVYKNNKLQTVKASGSATLLPTVGEDGETRYLVFVYLAPKGLPPHARCLEIP